MFPLLAAAALVQTAEIPFTQVLAIGGVTRGGRVPVPQDQIQYNIVSGKWTAPKEGDEVAVVWNDRKPKWTAVTANKNGAFEGPQFGGGYAYATYDSPRDQVMLLHATGDSMVYVNGQPRGGDPYSYGWLKVPVHLKKGLNEFLFTCGRGTLQAGLLPVQSPLQLNVDDATLPDITPKNHRLLLGIPVLNATDSWASPTLIVKSGGRVLGRATNAGRILPMSLRKEAMWINTPDDVIGRSLPLDIEVQAGGKTVDTAKLDLRVRKEDESYKETFISSIDGSVQYYAVVPALKPSRENALVMTLHGASVEARGQAEAYTAKDWCTIVAPTNRRPYGFDWEDWGRMDAMEVLGIAEKRFAHDPRRVILTGHSMGGHGTWQVGLTYPGKFAAIGPSAGWISFWSYAGGYQPTNPTPIEQMLLRAQSPSDTLSLARNTFSENVYILHGDKDDNVPVEQARTMRDELTKLGKQVTYHEQPGAGHWWGNECVDWPAMFEMFKNSDKAANEAKGLEFWTNNPGVSSEYRGYVIEQQREALKPSSLVVSNDVSGPRLSIENVAALRLPPSKLPYTINGQQFNGNLWAASPLPTGPQKAAAATGPFKLAFQNRFTYVIGTAGTAEENRWALNKARFDAESFYYRGNGTIEVMTDDEWLRKPGKNNAIFLGNRENNRALRSLQMTGLARITDESTGLGDHTIVAYDLAFLVVQPGRSAGQLYGILGATGAAGRRLLDRLPYFTSGVAYPDWTILKSDELTLGAGGILGCGFFSNSWNFDPTQTAWKPRP